MLDMKLVRENPDLIRTNLEKRNHRGFDLDALLTAEAGRREHLHQVEELRAAQNKASGEIARLKKDKQDIAEAVAATKDLSGRLKSLEEELRRKDEALTQTRLDLPNLLDDSVPAGKDESANRLEREWGTQPPFDFEPLDHVDLGEALGLFDFERAAKISGARFCIALGAGARLERALINFMLDTHTVDHGYTEILPPLAVNSATMQGIGQLPKFAEDLFRLADQDLWLIPTAEVPLTSLYAGEILQAGQLPMYMTAFTPCFRSEAGSYGKDTRGILRQHQFNKVELVKLCEPETSWDELEALTQNAEAILQRLGLHYRVVTLSGGDTGFNAAKTYDLEVWLPGQGAYREISSCSNCTDFQARRANIRYRNEKKPQFVHTLNGSGLAVGRTVIAILENYQQADGTVTIPEVLRPYMNGLEKIESESTA